MNVSAPPNRSARGDAKLSMRNDSIRALGVILRRVLDFSISSSGVRNAMARRSRAADKLLGMAVVAVLALGAIGAAFDAAKSIRPEIYLAVIGMVLALVMLRGLYRFMRARADRAAASRAIDRRRVSLLAKYQDEVVVNAVMAGDIWHDMTKAQLIDAWGQPDDVETKVMKSKIRETYKFGRIGVNRFERRAVLENDVVVAWELK